MKKQIIRLPWLLLMFAIAVPSMAQQVSEQVALEKARAFFLQPITASGKTIRRAPRKAPRLKAAVASSEYYIFNDEANQGFVIVSGDERTPDILGYSDEGCFDSNNIPDNVQEFLNGYTKSIRSLSAPAKEKSENEITSRAPIPPLLSSRWNQTEPYNLLTPTFNETHCVTGCVSTAMAQVMNYWKYPRKTIAEIPNSVASHLTYDGGSIPTGTAIDWENMCNTYYGSETEAQQSAVAQLMLFCGLSVNMNYGTNQSSAYSKSVSSALVKYFDYASGCTLLSKHIDYEDWIYTIYNELRQKRPVYYSGASGNILKSVGHAFVCDGYYMEDLFHINWGWGGIYNGYFRLEVMNPDGRGTGGGSGKSGGFSMYQQALIGVQPKDYVPNIAPLAVKEISLSQESYTRSSSSDNFSGIYITPRLFKTTIDKSVECGIALEQAGKVISVINEETTALNVGRYSEQSVYLSFGKGLKDGVYNLVPVCRKAGATNWIHDADADQVYVKATISGKTLTLLSQTSQSQFSSINLVCVGNPIVTGSYDTKGETTVSYQIQNNGSDFSGTLTLFVPSATDETQKIPIAEKDVYIKAGQTSNVVIPFMPDLGAATWDFALEFIDKKIDNSDFKMTLYPDLQVSFEVPAFMEENKKQDCYLIYDDHIEGSVTVTYPQVEGYAATITDSLLLYMGWYSYGQRNIFDNQKTKFLINLHPGESKQVQFRFDRNDAWNSFYSAELIVVPLLEEGYESYGGYAATNYTLAPFKSNAFHVTGSPKLPDIVYISPVCDPEEAGYIDGNTQYEGGATVLLTAHTYYTITEQSYTADYEFVNWTLDDEVISTTVFCSFTATKDCSPVAHFRKKPVFNMTLLEEPVLTGDIRDGGSGNISLNLWNEGDDYSGNLRFIYGPPNYYGYEDSWRDTVYVHVDIRADESQIITIPIKRMDLGGRFPDIQCNLRAVIPNVLDYYINGGDFKIYIYPRLYGFFTVLNADSNNNVSEDMLRVRVNLERVKDSAPMKGSIDVQLLQVNSSGSTSVIGTTPLEIDLTDTESIERELIFHRGNAGQLVDGMKVRLMIPSLYENSRPVYEGLDNPSQQIDYIMSAEFTDRIDYISIASEGEGTVGFRDNCITKTRDVDYSVYKGMTLHVYAKPRDGYRFDGWYDNSSTNINFNRFLSADSHYAFKAEDIMYLQAVFVPENEQAGFFSKNKLYTLKCPRGAMVLNADATGLAAGQKRTDATAEDGQFAIIHYKGYDYLYSPVNKKFLSWDGTFVNHLGSPIIFDTYVMDDDYEAYPYMLYTNNGIGLTFCFNNNGNIVINQYTTEDAGNRWVVEEVTSATAFDPTEALELIENSCKVTYEVLFNNRVAASTYTYVIKGSAMTYEPLADLNKSCVTLYQTSNVPQTITEDVTITYHAEWTGPFQFSTSLEDAKWYNLNIRNSYWVGKQDSEPYYPAQVNETTLATPEYQWAFGGDPYHVKVYNRATGMDNTLVTSLGNVVMRSYDYSWFLLSNFDGFVLRAPHSFNGCINHYNSGPLKLWENNSSFTDNGSTFRVEEVKEPDPVYAYNFNMSDGTFWNNKSTPTTIKPSATVQYAYKWEAYDTTDPQLSIIACDAANNMVVDTQYGLRIHTDTYFLKVPKGYIITGYELTAYTSSTTNSTINGVAVSTNSNSPTKITVTDLESRTASFTVVTGNPWIIVQGLKIYYKFGELPGLASGYYHFHAGMTYINDNQVRDKYLMSHKQDGKYWGFWGTPADYSEATRDILPLFKVTNMGDETYDIVSAMYDVRFTDVTKSASVEMTASSTNLMAIEEAGTRDEKKYYNIRVATQNPENYIYLHQDGHKSGKGTNGFLVGWCSTWNNNSGPQATEWYVEKVEENEAETIITTWRTYLCDINGDGKVTDADVTLLINVILGKDLDEDTISRADFNGDGRISISDVIELIRLMR